MRQIYIILLLIALGANSQTLDQTFNAGHNGPYREYIGDFATVTPDGKLLCYYRDVYTSIKKFNLDGSPDTSAGFTPPFVSCERIIMGLSGKFLALNTWVESEGMPISVFLANGSVDNSFICPLFGGDNAKVQNVLWQTDGKFLVVGQFETVNGIARKNIVRLNASGSVDTTFNPGTGADDQVLAVTRQPDGKYIIGGRFFYFNSVLKKRIARLNADGSNDTSFYTYTAGTQGFEEVVNHLILQPDGKILVGGFGFRMGSVYSSRMVTRLLPTGYRDTAFSCMNALSSGPPDMKLLPDGTLLVDVFSDLVKVTATGSIDPAFNYVSSVGNSSNGLESIFPLANGKIIYSKDFKSASGVTRTGVHLVNSNGSVDFSFNPQQSTNRQSAHVNVLQNSKIMVSGEMSAYNDAPCKTLIKLLPDGAVDASFSLDPQVSFSTGSVLFKEQPDNKLLYGFLGYQEGTFQINLAVKKMMRLQEDGAIDASFNFDETGVSWLDDMELLDDGKILTMGLGSGFLQGTGGTKRLRRYNSNGSVDLSYAPLLANSFTSLTKFPADAVFVIAELTFYNDQLYRLTPDGAIDTTFLCPFSYVHAVHKQSEGKYLVTYYGEGQMRIARINNDGSADNTFTTIAQNVSWESDIFSKLFVNSQGKIFILDTLDPSSASMLVYSANGEYETSAILPSTGIYDQQGCDRLIVSDNYFDSYDKIVGDIIRVDLTQNIVSAPLGESDQDFTDGETLANLEVTGQNIEWFADQNSCANIIVSRAAQVNEVLPINTPLVDGQTYYAAQTVGGMTSTYRLPVTVHSSLGIASQDIVRLSVTPNPATSYVLIRSESQIEKIEVFGLSGMRILETDCATQELNLEIGNWASGIYLLRVSSNGQTVISKIIKY